MNTKFIDIQQVAQSFKTNKGPFLAIRDINLTVAKGEFVTLIGHSGCGKSTLLNLIAGLALPTQGLLLCANREIAGPGPERAVAPGVTARPARRSRRASGLVAVCHWQWPAGC